MTKNTAEEIRTNLLALLHRDRVTPAALSFACGHNRSWMSRFLQRKRHELQLADLDRIADFFAVATYDLFRPSAGSITDRRKIRERRSGLERRVGHAQRTMLATAAELARVRGKGRDAQASSDRASDPLYRLIERFARDLDPLLAQAHPGGQTPVVGPPQPGARPRRRVAGGPPDPPRKTSRLK